MTVEIAAIGVTAASDQDACFGTAWLASWKFTVQEWIIHSSTQKCSLLAPVASLLDVVRVQDNQVAFIASCKEFFDLVEASFDAVGTTFAVVTSFAVECKWLIRLVQASG